MARWGIRIVSLAVLAFVLFFAFPYYVDERADGAGWLLAVVCSTGGWALVESIIVAYSAPGLSLRRRFMIDGLSLKGTPITVGAFLVVLVAASVITISRSPRPVPLDFLEMDSGGTLGIINQILFGLMGALVGIVAFLTVVIPITFTLAAIMWDVKNEPPARTWFGFLNRAELIGGSLVLVSVAACLVFTAFAVVDSSTGWGLFAALMIIPFITGVAVNNVGTHMRNALGITTPWDEPLIKRLFR